MSHVVTQLFSGAIARAETAGELAVLLAAFPHKKVYVYKPAGEEIAESDEPALFLDKEDIIICPGYAQAERAWDLAQEERI